MFAQSKTLFNFMVSSRLNSKNVHADLKHEMGLTDSMKYG